MSEPENQAMVAQPQRREIVTVHDKIPLFDTVVFEHMSRVAKSMARSSFLPEHLRVYRDGNGQIVKPADGQFDYEGTVGNCLAILNTARAWDMDPMAVAECTSLINGKRCYEGKILAALIDTKLGIKLVYEWAIDSEGNALSIKATHPDDPQQYVEGDLAGWKTSKWGENRKEYRKRLKYRADREWCRMWAPALMLGVYGDDEMEELRIEAAARRAAPVQSGVFSRLPGPSSQNAGGFSAAKRELAETVSTKTGAAIQFDKSTGGVVDEEISLGVSASEAAEASGAQGEGATAAPSTNESTQETTGASVATESASATESSSALAEDGGPSVAEAGQGNPSSPTLSRETLEAFSDALNRVESTKSLETMQRQFFEEAKIDAPAKGQPGYDQLRDVYALHHRRVTGKFSPAEFKAKLAELLQ